MVPSSLYSMSEGDFDFLDIDLDDFVDIQLAKLNGADPFYESPPGEIPSRIYIANALELADKTRNGVYTVVTRSVTKANSVLMSALIGMYIENNSKNNGSIWYQHTVWDNFGEKSGTRVGRRADILFKSTDFDSALAWHYKALKHLNDSGF